MNPRYMVVAVARGGAQRILSVRYTGKVDDHIEFLDKRYTLTKERTPSGGYFVYREV